MLKSYRKRFVLLNMLLVGVVLLISFAVQGVYSYQRSYSEMVNTMRLIVAPWDEPGRRFRSPGDEPPADMDGHPAPPELAMTGRDSINAEGLITVFYDRDTGELSVMSDDTSVGVQSISEAVEEIVSLEEGFGRLDSQGIFYYREDAFASSKIVIADNSYLYSKVLQSALVLLAAYIAAMALVYLISRKLSKLAAKPMEDAIELERQFITDISHDLKTPITV
ncbi:MAG: hypothetical protein IJG63_00280, partial [Oscillospiraceae bacterium]|nr:hypothetical protein [Oscillospiraceae bacterium]